MSFYSVSHPVCQQLVFESCENISMAAAILCPAVCVSDLMNKARMSGKSIKFDLSQPCQLFMGKEQTNMWLHPEELRCKAEHTLSA